MNTYQVIVEPGGTVVHACEGENLLELLRRLDRVPDVPCGGQGHCRKCLVFVNGSEMLACQTSVSSDMKVILPQKRKFEVFAEGAERQIQPDGLHQWVLAIDVGTTTVVAYLVDGQTGEVKGSCGCLNPQVQFGADVISRLRHAVRYQNRELQTSILSAMDHLTRDVAKKVDIQPEEIGCAVIVGNTAMHHLMLGIDPKPLLTPPYMPAVYDAAEFSAAGFLPIALDGTIKVLPNIAGFVGSDTVACMTAADFDKTEKLTLLIDIGTNGELVLGNRNYRAVCSAAAGPALEGAGISCGMRSTTGSIDRVWMEQGQLAWHVIGETVPKGLCGSGLLDLIAALLESGEVSETGFLPEKEYRLGDSEVILTQSDVRQVQLAKGAIRAGIELLCSHMGKTPADIDEVLLAGAFGSHLNPDSACKIGLIPPLLRGKVRVIGNAAGEGARLCALRADEFERSKKMARETEFLELASAENFQKCFVNCLGFQEADRVG